MPTKSRVQVVWFKRDLRVSDHRPLIEAAARGPVLPLYIAEPSLWHAPDADAIHWSFVRESLETLRDDLAALGANLRVEIGEAVDVLERLAREYEIEGLWAHEETGNALTYARDRAVRRWARDRGVPFDESPTGGTIRRLGDRDEWHGR